MTRCTYLEEPLSLRGKPHCGRVQRSASLLSRPLPHWRGRGRVLRLLHGCVRRPVCTESEAVRPQERSIVCIFICIRAERL